MAVIVLDATDLHNRVGVILPVMEDRDMGMVNISIQGSFGRPVSKSFSAMEGGHVMALARAIQALTSEIPHAIQLDHQLAQSGEKPPHSDFGQLPASAQVA